MYLLESRSEADGLYIRRGGVMFALLMAEARVRSHCKSMCRLSWTVCDGGGFLPEHGGFVISTSAAYVCVVRCCSKCVVVSTFGWLLALPNYSY